MQQKQLTTVALPTRARPVDRASVSISSAGNNKCNGFNDWTGPLACLSLSSVELVDKVRLSTGNTAFPVKFSPMKVRRLRVKVLFRHSTFQHRH